MCVATNLNGLVIGVVGFGMANMPYTIWTWRKIDKLKELLSTTVRPNDG